MREGTIVDNRFRITRLVGKGGMGTVYEGIDLECAAPVALKISHWSSATSAQRFLREAEALKTLNHPTVVHYIAHGTIADSTPYMAMEWLEGEDLGQRLARGPLTLGETLIVGMQVAEALVAAHGRGILHRDIKPGNLFLVNGQLDRIKVLDFGLAHVVNPKARTCAGACEADLMGTCGFFPPEQASGNIDERTDLYSLGVVLYSCLVQKPPFLASHVPGALAELLFEVVPRASESARGIPAELDDLIARLMAQNPLERMATAEDVMIALGKVPVLPEPQPSLATSLSLERRTRHRFWSVLVIGRDERFSDSSYLAAMARRNRANLVPSVNDNASAALFFTDRDLTTVVTFAAVCAAEIRAAFPDVRMALATGRSKPGAPVPVPSVLDRASMRWQNQGEQRTSPRRFRRHTSEHPCIDAAVCDEESAKIFVSQGAPELGARQLCPHAALPARFTSFLGRDAELETLAAHFDEGFAHRSARLCLVTGEPGMGKSRLGHELIQRYQDRDDVLVCTALGDPVRAASRFGLLRRLVCRAAARTALGPTSVLLVDRDASDEDVYRAWSSWLDTQTAGKAVLIVLDDLQWSDPASIRCMGAALRAFNQRPLIILALARPEFRDQLREDARTLWPASAYRELCLEPLGTGACAELARCVLPDASDTVIQHVVRSAQGNALHLEELTRRVATGRPGELPETLSAALKELMDNLGAAERRLLQAASACGRTFRLDEIESVLDYDPAMMDEIMGRLIEHEILTRDWRSGATAEYEYGFANPSIHEAVYGSFVGAPANEHRARSL